MVLKEVYGEDALREPTVNKWLKRFRGGRVDFKDDPRLGRPPTSFYDENLDRVLSCVLPNRCRMAAEELNLKLVASTVESAEVMDYGPWIRENVESETEKA
ncbi:hypothetical protein ILUMI_02032 [Ignelater luminosus]|uniref:Mos1 transposase HTH domain-containing protein n=1 Tax=Ignelater luminosus TaxID=2038154 RepID=A0A8K0DJ33_IGNLU|nr:hypothetical protein ILUMI_02032 [Ignelater luminosus]